MIDETVKRVHRKTHRRRRKLTFCLNMYRTKNRIMVNESDVDSVNKNHQLIVNYILKSTYIDSLERTVRNSVET